MTDFQHKYLLESVDRTVWQMSGDCEKALHSMSVSTVVAPGDVVIIFVCDISAKGRI